MFHIYFLGSSEGLVFDVANANFDVALWNPLRDVSGVARSPIPHRYVGDRQCGAGDAVRGATATRRRSCDADGVVLATDVAGLQRIVESSPGLGDDDWRKTRGGARHRPAVRGAAAVAGPPGEPRPARRSSAPADDRRWTTSACWSATNARRRDWSRAHRRFGRRTALLRGDRRPTTTCVTDCCTACTSCTPRRAAPAIVGEKVLCHNDCPRFAPGDFADRPERGHSARRPGAGRRRHPHRPAGRADGTRRDHRLDGGQPAARALRRIGATPCTPCRPRAGRRCCAGSPTAKGESIDEQDRRAHDRGCRRHLRFKCFRASGGRPAPDLPRRRPAVIDAALRRSQRRPSGNWYAFAASRRRQRAAVRRRRSRAWNWSRGAAGRHAARRSRRMPASGRRPGDRDASTAAR